MNIAEKIYQEVQKLRPSVQNEVLDFVEFLHTKKITDTNGLEWKNFSLASAMRGMEDEPSEYHLSDLKEKF